MVREHPIWQHAWRVFRLTSIRRVENRVHGRMQSILGLTEELIIAILGVMQNAYVSDQNGNILDAMSS
jgi:hypothetical protein